MCVGVGVASLLPPQAASLSNCVISFVQWFEIKTYKNYVISNYEDFLVCYIQIQEPKIIMISFSKLTLSTLGFNSFIYLPPTAT